jgi:hypothetical protein
MLFYSGRHVAYSLLCELCNMHVTLASNRLHYVIDILNTFFLENQSSCTTGRI